MNVFLRGTNAHDPFLLYNASIAHEKASRGRVYMSNIARSALIDILRLTDRKAETGEFILVWSILTMDCIMFMTVECAISVVMTIVHELERKKYRVSKIGSPLPIVLIIEWNTSEQIEYADTVGETYTTISDFRERFKPINSKLMSQTGLPAKLDVYAAHQMVHGGLPERRKVTFDDTKTSRRRSQTKPAIKRAAEPIEI